MFKNFTHLETNLTILPEVELDKHIKQILDGQIPIRLVPNMLHEITHHWSFLSPVGSIIVLLFQKAILAGLHSPTARNLLNFKVRYECICNFIRPISEGISLFMEHDVLPGKGDVRVPPFQLLFLITQGRDKSFELDSLGEMDTDMIDLLTRIRVSEHGIDRKERVLGEPFTLQSGGYLIGYLGLKSLNNKLKSENKELDSELFLSYINAYFFNDYELVQLLLDNTIDPMIAWENIYNYMVARVDNLYKYDLNKAIKVYEQYVGRITFIPYKEGSNFQTWQDEHLLAIEKIPGIFTDFEKARLGAISYRDAFQRHWENEFNTKSEFLNIFLYKVANREQICLGSLNVTIKINEFKRALLYHNGSLILAGPMLNDYPLGVYEGAFGIYISFFNLYKAFIVSIKGEPILIFYSNDPPKLIREHIENSIFDRDLVIELSRSMENMFEDFLAKQEFFDDLQNLLNCFYRETEIFMKKWSVQLLECGVKFKPSYLEENGLYGLFDDDLHAFKTFIEKSIHIPNDIEIPSHENQELKAIIEKVKMNYDFDLNGVL